MATIVNNPPVQTTDASSGSAGWAVAIIILLLVIVGLVAYFEVHRVAAAVPHTANINVTLPAPSGGGTGGAAAPAAPKTGY